MEIKNIGQLIQHLATKAGIAADDANLINILSNAELTKVTIHSDLVKGIDENLLSVAVAGDNHPVIGAKYKAQVLSTIDKKLENIIGGLEVDDAEKQRLRDIRSTYERQDAVLKLLQESKTATGEEGKQAAALRKQVTELAQKLQDSEGKVTAEIERLNKERKTEKINTSVSSLYGKRKTIYDDLDSEIKVASLDAVISKALQEKGAMWDHDENGKLVLVKSDGTKFLSPGHVEYTPDTFIDEIMGTKKLLVVNNAQQQQQQQHQQQQQFNADTGQQKFEGTNQSVADFNERQLQTASS